MEEREEWGNGGLQKGYINGICKGPWEREIIADESCATADYALWQCVTCGEVLSRNLPLSKQY